MQPLIALVGRPNVGKSTLFNQLTRSRDALVAAIPGLTRDRRYGEARLSGRLCRVVDTGGLLESDDQMAALMAGQVHQAISEADLVLFVVDARDGLTSGDQDIADMLRRSGVQPLLVINKVDGQDPDNMLAEFAPLGFSPMLPVSAVHRRNLNLLRERIIEQLGLDAEPSADAPPASDADSGVEATDADRMDAQAADVADAETAESGEASEDAASADLAPDKSPAPGPIRVAVVGRPNVGKSTLINQWLGEERLLVFDMPGTTRDAIEVPFRHGGEDFVLIDTAGIRRKGRVTETVEKFSVVKALDAMRSAQVAVLVINAAEGLVEQDLHLLQMAAESGAGLVLALNKWDLLDSDMQADIERQIDRRLTFAPWIAVYRISALQGKGVKGLLKEVRRVHKAAAFEHSTSALSRILEIAVTQHEPPAIRGRRIKLRFAHKAGAWPPHIMIHGNQTESVPAGYTRYLENCFRDALKLRGTPIRISYRTSDNPYADKTNKLTDRQVARRKRMIRYRKKRG